MLACLDRSSSRATQWHTIERYAKLVEKLLHILVIVTLAPLMCIAWTGIPVDLSAATLNMIYVAVLLAVLKAFSGTFKRVYLRLAGRPSKNELMVTAVFSTACIALPVYLSWMSRGFLSMIPLGDWSWQRAVMVGLVSPSSSPSKQFVQCGVFFTHICHGEIGKLYEGRHVVFT